MKRLNSNGILKDDTYLELPSKGKSLKMAFSGKLTTISCRIELSDCNYLSNSLIFLDPFTEWSYVF